MFDTRDYGAIFDGRGSNYDRAMQHYPTARSEEFQVLVRLANPKAGQAICDAPAGGGYMADYLPTGVQLTLAETSAVFHDLSWGRAHVQRVLASSLAALPLPADSFDGVLSLAGLHHNSDQPAVYREARRILKTGGCFCLADVHRDSAVASFLDGFIGLHLPEGHHGDYLTAVSAIQLEQTGFKIDFSERLPLRWRFASVTDMTAFCRLLFGVEHLTNDEMRAGLDRHLSVSFTADGVELGWELYYLRATAI